VSQIDLLIDRAHKLLDRLESIIPPSDPGANPDNAIAFRWRRSGRQGYLEPIIHISSIGLDDLLCIEDQKQKITGNTRQFLAGLPANNVLLWGPRGTGKSSLIKAVFNHFRNDCLKIIEVEKQYLADLPDIVSKLESAYGYFIIYCDDLSFSDNDDYYKSLKMILDGSISRTPDNLLIYATSNRRHLMPEIMQDNLDSNFINEELHPSEAVEEKISLSERFGLWLAFHPFNQDQYLCIVDHWLDNFGIEATSDTETRQQALQWALEHGSRSGRCAWQFARHWAGYTKLDNHD